MCGGGAAVNTQAISPRLEVEEMAVMMCLEAFN